MATRARLLALICAAIIGASAAPPPVAAAVQDEDNRSASTVTILYDDSHRFKGSVDSHHRCVFRRKVVVKRHRPGRNKIVASDRTNRSGNWKTNRRFRNGRFYAVVRRAVVRDREGERFVCRRDKSTTENI